MNEEFRSRDMSGTVFDNVNLGKATFYNVNLSDATIRFANLCNLSIEEANISGMTVFGIDVGALIEAELDRRDPDRKKSTASDSYDPDSISQVMGRIDALDPDSVRQVMGCVDALRAEFRERLTAVSPSLLCTRPSPEKWSVIEHVRHLIFAEQLYVNHLILQNEASWHPLGLLPTFMTHWQGFDGVGTQQSDDLDVVLAAWAEVHTQTRALVERLTPDMLQHEVQDLEGEPRPPGEILQNLGRHDLHHIHLIEITLQELNTQ